MILNKWLQTKMPTTKRERKPIKARKRAREKIEGKTQLKMWKKPTKNCYFWCFLFG